MSPRSARVSPVVVALAAIVCTTAPAHAQFRGSGARRPPPGGSDSADARPRRDANAINTVDVIMERRSDLGLTPDQYARVSSTKTRRDMIVDTLTARATALRAPTDPNAWTTMSDSDRVAMRDRLRARAAALRAQRDVESQARDDALAALTPDQRARAVKMEDDMRRSAFAEARLGNATRGTDSGTRGGGMSGGGGRMGTP